MNTNEKAMKERINQLEVERDQLAAKNERLHEAYQSYVESGFDEILERAFDEESAASLAEIQARAIECAVMKHRESMTETGLAWLCRVEELLREATYIRQQSKQGCKQ